MSFSLENNDNKAHKSLFFSTGLSRKGKVRRHKINDLLSVIRYRI